MLGAGDPEEVVEDEGAGRGRLSQRGAGDEGAGDEAADTGAVDAPEADEADEADNGNDAEIAAAALTAVDLYLAGRLRRAAAADEALATAEPDNDAYVFAAHILRARVQARCGDRMEGEECEPPAP